MVTNEIETFVFDTLVDPENFCNLEKEKKLLASHILDGKRTVIIGRRNTGKTSMVRSFGISAFRKKHKKNLVLFADLMNVTDLDSVHRRMNIALQESLKETFPVQSALAQVTSLLKTLRPTMSLDPISGPSFTVTTSENRVPHFQQIFTEISNINSKIPVLVVLDEFQDIAKISEAEALFRQALQKLSHQIPVVILGSKKHMLARIFANPDSPLAGYGLIMEIPPIPYKQYHEFILKRFKRFNLNIHEDVSQFLQDELSRIPESINTICYLLTKMFSSQAITKKEVVSAIDEHLVARRSVFEEYLGRFTAVEQKILKAMADVRYLDKPSSKAFIRAAESSQSFILKTIQKFLDDAVVYKMPEGYEIADPLIRHYLIKYR